MVTKRWVWIGGRDGGGVVRLGVRAVCIPRMTEIDWGYTELTKYCSFQQGYGLFLRILSFRSL